MNRADLDACYWQVIRRYLRRLADDATTPPPGLLDDLAAIAEQHAADGLREERVASLSKPDSIIATSAPEPKPAPRRTTRRTTAK